MPKIFGGFKKNHYLCNVIGMILKAVRRPDLQDDHKAVGGGPM
jgi:hypothetical protein